MINYMKESKKLETKELQEQQSQVEVIMKLEIGKLMEEITQLFTFKINFSTVPNQLIQRKSFHQNKEFKQQPTKYITIKCDSNVLITLDLNTTLKNER